MLVTLACAQSLSAQGMAAAAAKEKERRGKQKATTPVKNYETEQLGSVGTLANDTSVPPAEATTAATRPDAVTEPRAGSFDGGERGESYWRSRAQQMRAAVAAAEKKLKAAEGAAVQAGPLQPGDYKVPCQKGRVFEPGHTLGEEMNPCASTGVSHEVAVAAKTRVESARQALSEARQALANFEEEARRAGALPGWIR
jgi:hypothetical protein